MGILRRIKRFNSKADSFFTSTIGSRWIILVDKARCARLAYGPHRQIVKALIAQDCNIVEIRWSSAYERYTLKSKKVVLDGNGKKINVKGRGSTLSQALLDLAGKLGIIEPQHPHPENAQEKLRYYLSPANRERFDQLRVNFDLEKSNPAGGQATCITAVPRPNSAMVDHFPEGLPPSATGNTPNDAFTALWKFLETATNPSSTQSSLVTPASKPPTKFFNALTPENQALYTALAKHGTIHSSTNAPTPAGQPFYIHVTPHPDSYLTQHFAAGVAPTGQGSTATKAFDRMFEHIKPYWQPPQPQG